MQKQTIEGHEVEFELADEKLFDKEGAVPFYVKSLDGDEYDKYHVVIGKGDKTPVTPHLAAICLCKEDAVMIAAAINIAKGVADMSKNSKEVLKKVAAKSRELAESKGWDIAKAEAKIDELFKEGKSKEEILKYMKEHMMEFRKADAPKDDAQKSPEEW